MKKAHRMASTATLVRLALEGQDQRDWYRAAREDIERTARTIGVDRRLLAGLLAVTSPQVNVSRNWALAIACASTSPDQWPGMLPNSRSNALEVIDRHRAGTLLRYFTASYEGNKISPGPKVSAFGLNLLGYEGFITLDVWMTRAFGWEGHAPLSRVATRDRARGRVDEAARILGWTAAQTQAAIWSATYRRHFVNPNVPTFRGEPGE